MKRKFNINHSKRQYLFIFVEEGKASKIKLDLEDLLMLEDNAFEYLYALSEEIDSILDLQVNDSLYTYANRDNVNSKGVLTRIA